MTIVSHAWIACCLSASLTGTLTAPVQKNSEVRPDIILADFETDPLGWQVEGRAFQMASVRQQLPNQQAVTGSLGSGFINSYQGGDPSVGKMVSPPFKIERSYISFLVGGGNDRRRLTVQLLIDGKVMASATGKNIETLRPVVWNIKRYEGRSAVILVKDESASGWGHILADHFLLTDRVPPNQMKIDNRRYLVVPVYFDDTRNKAGHDLHYYRVLMGDSWPGLNYYFKRISGGRVTFEGSKVLPYRHFPGTAVSYMNEKSYNSSANGQQMTWDFKKLADTMESLYPSEFDKEHYYGIIFCPNVVDQFGGGAATWIERTVGSKKRLYPVAFLNPTQGQSVWMHEISHHFGMGHIRRNYDGKAENQYSAMSGDYHNDPVFPPYDRVGRGHMSLHLRDAGWLTQDQIAYMLPTGDKLRLDLSSLYAIKHTDGVRCIIVPMDESHERYFIVESRAFSEVDRPGFVKREGIVIHYMDHTENEHEPMLIWGPSPFGEWAPGARFDSDNQRVTIKVVSRSASGFLVDIEVK